MLSILIVEIIGLNSTNRFTIKNVENTAMHFIDAWEFPIPQNFTKKFY